MLIYSAGISSLTGRFTFWLVSFLMRYEDAALKKITSTGIHESLEQYLNVSVQSLVHICRHHSVGWQTTLMSFA